MGVQFNPNLLHQLGGSPGGNAPAGANNQQEDNNNPAAAAQFAGIGQQNAQAQQTPPAIDPSQGQRLNVLG